jgi:hypothetical protein
MPRMTNAEYQSYLARTNPSAVVKSLMARPRSDDLELETIAVGDEIESLHKPFLAWTKLYAILPLYSRSDKPTSNTKGQFDFPLMKNGLCCAVEFKAGKNKTSKDQRDWQERAESCGVPCLVTTSFREATEFAMKHLKIEI